MYPIPKTIWRPEKVVALLIEQSISNVRTTGQCSIWKRKLISHVYEFYRCGYIF